MKTITTEAKVDNLAEVLSFLDAELENADCGMKETMQIDIAVEELFVNVSSYAYSPGSGEITVSIEINSNNDSNQAVITLTDSGIPYNPLLREDPDITLSAEERSIGGLGIFMVKESMDEMRYQRADDHNIVTIIKNF